MPVSIPCVACNQPIHVGDDFCPACGRRVDDDGKRALNERLEGLGTETRERAHHVREASKAIAVLAVLFVLGGVIFFAIGLKGANDALAQLATLDDHAVIPEPINGVTYSVAELRAAVEREPYQALGLNLFLALVMLGLYFWSRRAALPAILTAMAIYVAVHVGNAIVDPMTIAQGIIVKVVAVLVLARGIRAALAARAFERQQARRLSV